jgi:hypothetical protein
MPLFKKTKKSERKKQRAKGTTNPTGKVYMPKSKTSSVKRKGKKKFNLLKKENSKPSIRRRKKRNFSKIFFYVLFTLISVGLLYASFLSVIRMRSNTADENTEVEYVVGLDGIPSYPGSVFIFKNNVKEISVANFIATGNSAYRLPLRTTTTQAYEYYQRILPELGWENVLSVEVGSEEMKEGEYWVKGSNGLRIYSKFNDLWYETLTQEEAITGLRARVVEEAERELLLASQDYQELLPDFPWALKVPKEYIISYSSSAYEDFRAVQFRKIGFSEKVSVVPIGSAGEVLDDYLREYTDLLGIENEESWTITNTILAVTTYGTALRGSITNGSENHDVAVVSNTYNGVVYVIDANTPGDTFLDYIFENMEPANIERE